MSVSELSKILYSKNQLEDVINEIAKKIDDDFYENVMLHNEELVLIGILKGSYIFLSDLSRSLNTPHKVDFMTVKSYSDTKSTGTVQILNDLRDSITNKHIIIVEDIVDTGLTLNYLSKILKERTPKSLEVCTLLRKPTEAKIKVDVKYIGFEIDPEFVVGYGLDYNEWFRNLDCIGIPTKEAIEIYKLKNI